MLSVRRILPLALCAFLGSVSLCSATLIDRGSGLIYDDVLDVTWLQDADYAQTSGASPFGRMAWGEAEAWASSLSYTDTVRGTTWDDWRLPTTINAPSSNGYDPTGLSSELAFMYYVNLGYAANYGDQSSPEPSSSNYNPFVNLHYRGYWSGTTADNPEQAWFLHFHFGSQGFTSGGGDSQYVWLLRDGDVGAAVPASVPEPTSVALVGLGLAGYGCFRRKVRGQ